MVPRHLPLRGGGFAVMAIEMVADIERKEAFVSGLTGTTRFEVHFDTV